MRNLFRFTSGEQYIAANEQIAVTLAGLFFSVLTMAFVLIPERSSLLGYNWWMLPGGLVIYIIGQIWNLIWLLRLERRRFAAFDENRWLARTQPVPLPFIVQLSSIITWRIKWTYITPWLLVMGWWLVFANRSIPALIVTIGIILLLYSFIRFELEITEDGLTGKGFGNKKKTVVWSEAHFFACYRIPILFWNKNIIHYELSGRTTRVSWVWVHNLQSPFTAWKPGLPSDEYEQQMQALCALIMKKTGLPLYDLSQPVEKNLNSGQ